MKTAARPKIGLLALTLEFYETLAPGLRPAREAWLRCSVVPALTRQADILFSQAVFRREDIERAVSGFEAAGADALLVIAATYSPSQLSLPALSRTRLPLLIWNTQELAGVDANFTIEQMIDNHGVHGTQDLANVLRRAGVDFHYVTSRADDARALEEIGDFAAAAAAVRRLRSARIGQLGYPFPGMGDFAVDTTHLAATLGCSWVNLSLEDFIQRAAAADSGKVSQLVEEYRAQYQVADDITAGDLNVTAAAELAMRGMVEEHRLDAFTYQFLAFGENERSPTLPFVAASRLMADGVGFAGEGDLVGAAGSAFLNWLMAPASFSEIFTIDFAGESVFLSHMGEANVAMARRGIRVPLVARPTPITRTLGRQLTLVTSLEPGPATLAALALGPGGTWRWIVSWMAIEDFGPLPGLYVPHFKLKPASGSVAPFLTAYALAGGPHHNAVCFGDARRRLRFAAQLLGAEYCEV